MVDRLAGPSGGRSSPSPFRLADIRNVDLDNHLVEVKDQFGAHLQVTLIFERTRVPIKGEVWVLDFSLGFPTLLCPLGTERPLATEPYVDDAVFGATEDLMPKSGGTFTGPVTLSGGPSADLHAATKKYVDDELDDLDTPFASVVQQGSWSAISEFEVPLDVRGEYRLSIWTRPSSTGGRVRIQHLDANGDPQTFRWWREHWDHGSNSPVHANSEGDILNVSQTSGNRQLVIEANVSRRNLYSVVDLVSVASLGISRWRVTTYVQSDTHALRFVGHDTNFHDATYTLARVT